MPTPGAARQNAFAMPQRLENSAKRTILNPVASGLPPGEPHFGAQSPAPLVMRGDVGGWSREAPPRPDRASPAGREREWPARAYQRVSISTPMPCSGLASSLSRRVALTPTLRSGPPFAGARRQPRL